MVARPRRLILRRISRAATVAARQMAATPLEAHVFVVQLLSAGYCLTGTAGKVYLGWRAAASRGVWELTTVQWDELDSGQPLIVLK